MRHRGRIPGARPARSTVPFLLCDGSGNFAATSTEGRWVRTPVGCLEEALADKPTVIAVRFPGAPVRDRKVLLELCAALKHDKHLERTPVLALIYAGNHTLMENLERAGVEFVTCVGDTILNPDLLTEIIVGLGPDDRIERKLKVVCRHIHWEMIDSEHEMALCGAYRNRMVLGYGRLHSLCETEDHRQCEYFLDPRIRS